LNGSRGFPRQSNTIGIIKQFRQQRRPLVVRVEPLVDYSRLLDKVDLLKLRQTPEYLERPDLIDCFLICAHLFYSPFPLLSDTSSTPFYGSLNN
jgi:hypothetical protein